MKTDTKLTIVSVLLVIIVCLVLWKDEIFKSKTTPMYSYTIVITNKRTGDTLMNKVILLDHKLSSDSLKFYLVKSK